jgi:hypothetical protein
MCDFAFECVLSGLALLFIGASWLMLACWGFSLC